MIRVLPLLATLAGAERSLEGLWRTLPASAPENKVLLDMDHLHIRDTFATIGDAFEQNHKVAEHLDKIISTPYFSTYKVDLSDHRCPFEDDSATCANRQCAIEPLSSENVDDKLFASQFLGRLRKNSVSTVAPDGIGEDCAPASGLLYNSDNNSRDYCYPEDESEESGGVWVDLKDNTERFTGYAGEHANLMWEKVYGENCFGYFGEGAANGKSTKSSRRDVSTQPQLGGAADQLARMFADPGLKSTDSWVTDHLPMEECVEQRLFYRLLSGMHASISTHLSFDWYNATSGEWEPNLAEWLERVGWHEDRLNNMFFDYVLVSRAVSKLVEVYERLLVFSSSCFTVDNDVRIHLRRLGRLLRASPIYGAINEDSLFSTPEGKTLKSEFRRRVRNVNALMSCVGCERCRLWGKIQTVGYGTALKILFELPSNPADDKDTVAEVLSTFRRSELVALINTFGRLSHSLSATERFQFLAEGKLINQASFSHQTKLALRETKVALKFIMWSYIQFPKNMFKLAILYASHYWNQFISGGAPTYTEVDFDSGFHEEL